MKRPHVHQMTPELGATCQRMMGNWLVGWACGCPMEIVVTKNPTARPYDELVVRRCVAGHIESGDGILSEPLILHDEADDGC